VDGREKSGKNVGSKKGRRWICNFKNCRFIFLVVYRPVWISSNMMISTLYNRRSRCLISTSINRLGRWICNSWNCRFIFLVVYPSLFICFHLFLLTLLAFTYPILCLNIIIFLPRSIIYSADTSFFSSQTHFYSFQNFTLTS
jgi:hypothetical protein